MDRYEILPLYSRKDPNPLPVYTEGARQKNINQMRALITGSATIKPGKAIPSKPKQRRR